MGTPYNRKRWRQVNTVDPDAEPELVDLEINQPAAAEVYYGVCAKIDQHNRHRQDTLRLGKKLKKNCVESFCKNLSRL
jgi:hypothetical protein